MSTNQKAYSLGRHQLDQKATIVDWVIGDANPRGISMVGMIGWREIHAPLFAELGTAHTATTKPRMRRICLFHTWCKYRGAFGVEILNSWLNEIYLLTASSFPDLFPDSEDSHQISPSQFCVPVGIRHNAPWLTTPTDSPGIPSFLTFCTTWFCFVSQPLAIPYSQGRTTGFSLKQTSYLLHSSDELRATALRVRDGGKCENPTIQRLLSNMRLISAITLNPSEISSLSVASCSRKIKQWWKPHFATLALLCIREHISSSLLADKMFLSAR